jgi:hypothetical protein
MVHGQTQPRPGARELPECAELARREQHHRDVLLLGEGPEPLRRRVVDPSRVRGQEDQPHAGDDRVAEQLAHGSRVPGPQIDARHHPERLGRLGRAGDGVVVAVALEERRHEDGAVHTGLLHLGQQARPGDRVVPVHGVSAVRAAWRPRPVRPLGQPYVHLGVDDGGVAVGGGHRSPLPDDG